MPPRTRDVMLRLEKEGWIKKEGKGDHVVFRKPMMQNAIAIDTGKTEMSKGMYASIAKKAGWK